MNMSRIIRRVLASVVLGLLLYVPSFAQDGASTAYSPYSVFGIGDLYNQGTARDRAMGGVGIAGRDGRYINVANPAAISSRDTLSVMFDLGLINDNKVFRQGDFKSANNILNINNFAFTFPVWRKTAVMVGISPYSSVGYGYSHDINDPELLSTAGFVSYSSAGNGGLYQLYGGVGTRFFKRLSVGVDAVYYFGNISKETTMSFTNSSFRTIKSGYSLELRGAGAKAGIQYEQPMGDKYMVIGATYNTSAKLKGYVTDYKYASLSSVTDTVSHHVDTLSGASRVALASEIGVGISFRKPDKWLAEVNYVYRDWTSSGFEDINGFANKGDALFTTTKTHTVKAGFEYIPNRNDIRYYLRQCAYRAGAYYEQAYYKLDGNMVNSYGITLGMTFPVFRWYNGVNIGIDVGRKGSVLGNMTRETYAKICVGFSIHDQWFRKFRYD